MTAAICAVIGHHWRVDDALTATHDDDFAPLYCSRCGRRRPLGATPTPEMLVNSPVSSNGGWVESEIPHPHEEQQAL